MITSLRPFIVMFIIPGSSMLPPTVPCSRRCALIPVRSNLLDESTNGRPDRRHECFCKNFVSFSLLFTKEDLHISLKLDHRFFSTIVTIMTDVDINILFEILFNVLILIHRSLITIFLIFLILSITKEKRALHQQRQHLAGGIRAVRPTIRGPRVAVSFAFQRFGKLFGGQAQLSAHNKTKYLCKFT
jgi:hypothetical protein